MNQTTQKTEKRCSVIRVPMAELTNESYVQVHVDIMFNHEQGKILKQIRKGLDHEGARLINGRRVVSNADVLRFMIENSKPTTKTEQ